MILTGLFQHFQNTHCRSPDLSGDRITDQEREKPPVGIKTPYSPNQNIPLPLRFRWNLRGRAYRTPPSLWVGAWTRHSPPPHGRSGRTRTPPPPKGGRGAYTTQEDPPIGLLPPSTAPLTTSRELGWPPTRPWDLNWARRRGRDPGGTHMAHSTAPHKRHYTSHSPYSPPPAL